MSGESSATDPKSGVWKYFKKDEKCLSTYKRQQDYNGTLARMICLDLQPISIWKSKHYRKQRFKRLCRLLTTIAYNVPDQQVLRNNLIPELYMKLRSQTFSKS